MKIILSSHKGLKFDLSSYTPDSEEASALGYLSDRIMIYSNSWGPGDYGFIVDGPGLLTKAIFSNEAHKVRSIALTFTYKNTLFMKVLNIMYVFLILGTRRKGFHLCLGFWKWRMVL